MNKKVIEKLQRELNEAQWERDRAIKKFYAVEEELAQALDDIRLLKKVQRELEDQVGQHLYEESMSKLRAISSSE